MMTWAELLDSIEQEVREVFPVKRFKLDVLKEHIHNGPSTLIDVKVTDKTSGKRLLIDCHQLKRKELRIQEVEFLANYALDEHCTHAAIIASPDANLTDQVQEHAVRVGVAVARFQPSTFRRNIGQVFDNAAVLQKKKQHGDARKNDTSLNLNSTVRTHAQDEKHSTKSGSRICVPRKISCRSWNGRYQVKSEGVLSSKVPPRDLVSSSWWIRKGTSTLWKTNAIQVQPSDVWQIHHVPNLQQLPQHLCEDLTQQSRLTFHSAPKVVQKQRYTELWEIRQNSLWLFNTPQGANHVSDLPIRTMQTSRVQAGGIVPIDSSPTENQTKVRDGTFHSQSWQSFTAATKTSQPREGHSREVPKDSATSDNCTAIPKTPALTMTETMRKPPTNLFAVTTGDETSLTPISRAQETVKVTGIVQSKTQKNGANDISVVLRYPKAVKQKVLEPIVNVVGKVGEVVLVKTMSVALLQLKTIVDTLFPLVGEFPTHLVKTLAYSVHLVRVSSTLIRRTPQRHAKKHRRAKHPARRDTAQCSHGGRLLVQGWRPIASLQNFQPMGRQRQQPIKMPGIANVCHVGRHHRNGVHIHEERIDPDTTQDGQRNESRKGDENVLSGPDDDALHPQSAVSEVAPVKAEPSGDEQTYNSSSSTSRTDDVESLSPVKAEHLEQHDLETSANVASTEAPSHDQGVELTTTTCVLENEEDSMVNLKEETPEALRDDGRGGFSFIEDNSDDDITNDVMLKPVLHGLFEPLKTDSNVKREAAIMEDRAPEHCVGINTREETRILSDESDEDNDMLFIDEPLGGKVKAESLDSGCAEEEACPASSRKSSSSSFYSFLSFFSLSSSSSSSSSNFSPDDSKIKKDGEKDIKEEAKIPRIETVDSEAVDGLCKDDGTGREKYIPFDIGGTRVSHKLSGDSSRSSSISSSSDSVPFATPTRLSSGEINRVKYSNSPLNKHDGSPDMRIRVNRSRMLGSPDGSPRNANGTPDMRWTENRTSLCVKSPQGVPLNVNKSPDMRWKFNRAALLQTSPQGALLNVDGSPDRRFKVTRNLARRGRSDVSTRTLVFN